MELNQDINVLHVINWLKLVFPDKYGIRERDDSYYIFIKYDEGNQYVGFLYKELGTIYLGIPQHYIGLATNSIILDLKIGFNLSERYTKIHGYIKDLLYIYKITFKE